MPAGKLLDTAPEGADKTLAVRVLSATDNGKYIFTHLNNQLFDWATPPTSFTFGRDAASTAAWHRPFRWRSLVNCLKCRWRGPPLRDADFLRHEVMMAMLQYRHKSRAWRFMVSTDESGNPMAIKDKVQQGTNRICLTATDRRDDLDTLMNRMTEIRTRLSSRMTDLPRDEFLRAQLSRLSTQTLQVLAVSQAWDVFNAGAKKWMSTRCLMPRTGIPISDIERSSTALLVFQAETGAITHCRWLHDRFDSYLTRSTSHRADPCPPALPLAEQKTKYSLLSGLGSRIILLFVATPVG